MNLSTRLSNAKRTRYVIARTITLGALLVLPACHIPKLRESVVGLALPASFNGATGPESSGQLAVEEFYTDPILTHLICQAMVGNRELKILEEEVEIARNEILLRRGAYLPFLGFRGSGGLDRPSRFTPLGAAEEQLEYFPGKHFPDPLPDSLVGLNLFWQLDIWRELRNARDAATQRYFGALERRNYFVTRLVADIAESYYGLMALDKKLETLDQTIALQEQSLKVAQANFAAGRGTDLPVQRFQAEVRKNQSEKLIVRQEIVEQENRINFLVGRFPQAVERVSTSFIELSIHPLSVGLPAQLLLNRPDVRQAEREIAAAGLEVKVARARFFPRLDLNAGVGYQAFNPKYLFMTPEALIATVAGDLTAPLINKAAIKADYLTANARQLESVYNYQRVILDAFTEVVNRLSKVENYRKSIEIKKQQLEALQASVDVASKLFQNARAEYIEVLFAQRDLLEARTVLIDTKRQQLSAIVNAYQALGGGYLVTCPPQAALLGALEPQHLPQVQQPLPSGKGGDAPMSPQLPAPNKKQEPMSSERITEGFKRSVDGW
jgi:NodT family efflux transporter outer membrane factor (OMF) lipoprotein